MCFCVWVAVDLSVCKCLMSCLCLSVDWIHEWASVCSCLCCSHAFFSCLLSWLLLRSRDKAHWCLSAPWQITEADRYKDSSRQLQYTGGQRRTCLGYLSWPQHQSSLNAIWLLYAVRASSAAELITVQRETHVSQCGSYLKTSLN